MLPSPSKTNNLGAAGCRRAPRYNSPIIAIERTGIAPCVAASVAPTMQ